MLQYLKNESNKTFTENGAATLKTTESDCVDLFATIGALRRESEDEIVNRFIRAFTENRDIATKLLFYARDVRGGLGERRVFRVILKWLANNHPFVVRKNLSYISEYGRYDDLFVLFDTPLEGIMLRLIRETLLKDIDAMAQDKTVTLLAKWLPSVNTSNKEAVKMGKKIAEYLDMSEKEYRKTLSELRAYIRIIENNLREKDYTFDYSKQPSKAMFKYRAAFIRNDEKRYLQFIDDVSMGKTALHADTLYPYELVDSYIRKKNWGLSQEEKDVFNATWSSLPSFNSTENALAVVDTSGSMYYYTKPTPASVALSLGLYFAEHNTGVFKNHFIEFSYTPELIEIKGDTFVDRLDYILSFNKIADTNLEAVFDLLLEAAVKNNVPQSELPTKLIIISDMEFNECVEDAELTNFEIAKKKFEQNGYKLPQVVFWNVASRNQGQPVTQNEEGVFLVSGCSQKLFSVVTDGDLSACTPYQLMIDVLSAERYERIVA